MKARQKGKQNAKFQFTFDLVKALRKKFQPDWMVRLGRKVFWEDRDD